MPNPVLMRRMMALPTGYPTTGLVAYFDLMQDNLLLQSQTFDTTWTRTRCYIAANCAADPITGAITVDKLVEDGTAGADHSLSGSTAALSGVFTLSFVIKPSGRTWALVVFGPSGKWVYLDLVNGVAGTNNGVTSVQSTDVGGGYLRWELTTTLVSDTTYYVYTATANSSSSYSGLGHQGTAAAGGDTDTAILAAGASAVDDVYNATEIIFSDAPTVIHTVTDYNGTTKACDFTPARSVVPDGTTYTVGPGILIARAQLNPGTSLRDYQVTTDLQTLSSLYGKSVTAQRGTTAGAEASDGSFGANGWNGVTDDVMVSSALPDGTMAAPFDIPLVGLFNGTAGTIVSLAASAVTTHYQRVAYNGSGQIRIGSKAGAGAETFSADLAVSTADILGLRFRSDGTTLTLTNHATGTSVTLASQSPTGACRLGIECTAGSTVADIADAITATLVTLHGAMLSTAGWTRAYRSLKARAARKGVTVLP